MHRRKRQRISGIQYFFYILGSNDSLRHQRLSERVPLRSPLHALLNDQPMRADGAAAHDPTFVVEVGEHDEETAVPGSEGVFDWHFDVIECDVCCSRKRGLEPRLREKMMSMWYLFQRWESMKS